MIDLESPLDPGQLSPEARRAVTGNARLMAARGLAPLSNPRDLVSVLYQLTCDSDPRVHQAARKTAAELPEPVAVGALRRADIDPRVLNLFARLGRRDGEIAKTIILNQATAGETIAEMARRASEIEIELIASNEQRLLRHPAIIAAMYGNENGRLSTVNRVLELAIHNGVDVDGIPGWEDLKTALLESGRAESESDLPPVEPDGDETVADMIGRLENDRSPTTFKHIKELAARKPQLAHRFKPANQLRLAMQGEKQTVLELLRSTKKMIARAAIRSPAIKENDAAKIAGNHAIGEAVIEEIARRRDWTKMPMVKLALVKNPKCPLPAAMRFLPFLNEKQIREIARSKGVPSALSAQARKLLMQRGGGRRR